MSDDAVWTTAYQAALADPADTLPFMPQPRAFRGQTIRQVVRLRRGAGRLRLVLSNEFGAAPLEFDEVTVAGAQRGGQARPALLGGRVRWRIPPGAAMASDPVELSVEARGEVAVSCYAAGHAWPGAFLHSAQHTGQAAPGNQAAADGGAELEEAQSFPSLYWISGVLAGAPADGPVIITLGDSVTRGDGTTVDAGQRYPDHLQARLDAAGRPGGVVLNAGIGGNRLLRPRVGPSMARRLARDVLGVPEATHVIIMGGINDLGLPGLLGERRPAAQEIIDGLFGLARRASDGGVQPVLGTITPILGRYDFLRSGGNEDIRQRVNRAILEQDQWPAVDFATALAEPADPGRLAAAYDSGDGVHPGDAGARALADAVDLSVFDPAGASRLRDKHQAPPQAACFQPLLCEGPVRQRVRPGDAQGELARRRERGQRGQRRPVGVDVDGRHPYAAQRDRPRADERGEHAARPDRVERRVAEHGRVEGPVHPAGNNVADGVGEAGRARHERGGAKLAHELLVAFRRRGDNPQAAHGRELHAEPAEAAGRAGHQDRLPGRPTQGVQGLDGGQAVERQRRRGSTADASRSGRDITRVEHDLVRVAAKRLVEPVPQPDDPLAGGERGDAVRPHRPRRSSPPSLSAVARARR
jgi:lysophospholipase L1-like esterase